MGRMVLEVWCSFFVALVMFLALSLSLSLSLSHRGEMVIYDHFLVVLLSVWVVDVVPNSRPAHGLDAPRVGGEPGENVPGMSESE